MALFTQHVMEIQIQSASHEVVEEMNELKTLQIPAKTGPTNGRRYKDTKLSWTSEKRS